MTNENETRWSPLEMSNFDHEVPEGLEADLKAGARSAAHGPADARDEAPPLTEVRKLTMYRSAHHPEFIAGVIVPALELAGLDERCAPAVADLVDNDGCTVMYAVNALAAVMVDYGTPLTEVPR